MRGSIGSAALAAASRHPGVALTIAEMNYPDQTKSITAAVLLFLLVTAFVPAAYVRWIRGRTAHLERTEQGQQ